MTETSEDYELFHYGVKGMKWGQRNKGPTRREKNAANDERVHQLREDLKVATAERKGARQEYRSAKKDARRSRTEESIQNKEAKKLQLEKATRKENVAYLAQLGERTTREKRIERLNMATSVATLAVGGGVAALAKNPQFVYNVGNGVSAVHNKKLMNSGLKAAAKIMADNKGLPARMTISGEVIER